jgi:hypothetical protein
VLQGILGQLLNPRDYEFLYRHEEAAEDLARSWFENKKAKTQVATWSANLGWMKGPLKQRPFDCARRTLSGSIGCWR